MSDTEEKSREHAAYKLSQWRIGDAVVYKGRRHVVVGGGVNKLRLQLTRVDNTGGAIEEVEAKDFEKIELLERDQRGLLTRVMRTVTNAPKALL